MKVKASDFIIIAAVLLMVSLFFFRKDRAGAQTVCVKTAEKTYLYSIKKDGEYHFDGKKGDFKIEIKKGKVRVSETQCREKTCMHTKISKSGQSIVCLPNMITVSLKGQSEADEVAY